MRKVQMQRILGIQQQSYLSSRMLDELHFLIKGLFEACL